MGNAAEAEGARIDTAIARVAKRVGAAFLSTELIKQIATVRGEFQQLEVAFQTMLGSKAKANALMSQMVDTAAKTPFDLQSVAGGAKQLLAYGSASEKVNDELIMLGNIASGLSIPLGDMVYLYGTTQTQGRLFTQDMRQFMGRGIPLADELAKQMGVTKQRIGEMVTEGKIGFPEVQKALQSMTSEGSKFYNLMEEQSKTITGQISNLGDAVDVMFNNIGRSQEGVISGTLSGATYVVENYEKVLDILTVLVATYGTYKATLMLVAAWQQAAVSASSIKAFFELAKGITSAKDAMLLLNMATGANPLGLFIGLLSGVIAALVVFRKSADDTNRVIGEQEQAIISEGKQVNLLVMKITNANTKEKERKEALNQLKTVQTSIVEGIDNEANATRRLTDNLVAYNQEQIKRIVLAQKQDVLAEVEKRHKEAGVAYLNREIEAQKQLETILAQVQSGKYRNRLVNNTTEAPREGDIKKRTEDITRILNDSTKTIRQKLGEVSASLFDTTIIRGIGGQGNALRKSKDELTELGREMVGAELQVDSAMQDIADTAKRLNIEISAAVKGTAEATTASFDAEVKAAKEAIVKIDKELKDLRSGVKPEGSKADFTFDVAIKEKEKEKKDAQDTLNNLLNIDPKAATKAGADAIKAQQKIADAQLKNIFDTQKEQADAMADGLAKELKQIEQAKEAKIAAIDKEERELKEKYKGKEVPKDQADVFQTRRDTATNDAKVKSAATEQKYAKEVKTLYAQIGDVFLSEEDRKRKGIQETYDQYREQLKKRLDGGEITQAEYDLKLPEIDAAQKQAELKPLLDQYQSHTDQRKEIERKFNDDIATLRRQAGKATSTEERNRLNAAADLASQKMRESVASLNIETLKKNINWDSVFGDLSKSSTASISHTLEQVQQLFDLDKGNMNAVDIRDMTQAIEQMQDELGNRNPFSGLVQSFKAIGKAKNEIITALNEYKESYVGLTSAQNEYNAALAEKQLLDEQVKSGELAEDSDAYAAAKNRVAAAADKQAKAEQQCIAAEAKAYTANNKLSRSYATFTSRLGAVHGMIGKVGANAKNLAAVFDSDVADKIGKALGFVDEVVDATTSVVDEIGEASSTVTSAIDSTVNAASQGMTAAGGVAVTTMSTMEKASVILAVIAAALQIATAIANLFNNDKAHQEEIDALQERIKQLQWELDNMEVGRLKNNGIDILKNMRDTYAEITKEVLQLHAAEIARFKSYAGFIGPLIYQNEILIASAEKLAEGYTKIEYTKTKALSGAKYTEAQDALKNMAQQQLLLQKSINEERAKDKDVDTDQIADWEREIQELGVEAIELINEMVEDIIGGSVSDIANDLGSAFFEAFQNGEDAAEAWGNKVNDIVADIMKRMLVQEFLEGPLGEVFNEYKNKWFGNGKFSLDTVINSMGDFANDLMGEGDKFKAIWDNLPDNIKDMFKPLDDEREASERGIATASQDSVDENNGRLTAIQGHTYGIFEGMKLLQPDVTRIKDMMGYVMNSAAKQLEVLQGIEVNTRSLSRLEKIESDMGAMKNTLSDISLKGIKMRPQ